MNGELICEMPWRKPEPRSAEIAFTPRPPLGRLASLLLILCFQLPANASEVVAWGSNGSGETNVPSPLTDAVGILACCYSSFVLHADGTVIGWGNDYLNVAEVPAGLTNVTAIAGKENHVLALLSDGTVRGWGSDVCLGQGWYYDFCQQPVQGNRTVWRQDQCGQCGTGQVTKLWSWNRGGV